MKNILIGLVLLLIGFFSNEMYIKMSNSKSKTVVSKEHKQIIKQLIELNNNKVIVNNCELIDINNTKILKNLTVNDFLMNYINASLNDSIDNGFECSTRKEKMCSLSFGELKSNEGWNRFLFFKYDFKHKLIIPNSFECIDVP